MPRVRGRPKRRLTSAVGRGVISVRSVRLRDVPSAGQIRNGNFIPHGTPRRVKRTSATTGVRLELLLPAEATWSPSQTAFVLEHVLGGSVDRPVVALARFAALLGQLLEALVQAEVVPDRVLPAVVLAVEEVVPGK